MKDKTPEKKLKKDPNKKPSIPSEKSGTPAAPLPGLSKKTRPELIAIAQSLGLSTEEKDRRIDLIEKIKAHGSGSSAAKPPKGTPKVPAATPARSSTKAPPKRRVAEKTTVPAPPIEAPPTPIFASPAKAFPHTVIPGALGWKDFLDIPFEPFRREKGHFVTLLPLSPFRIMAFFGTDPNDSSPAFKNGHPEIVLKIRDITKAMEERPRPMADDLPADYVFDVGTGMADRWRIPIWSTHRWIEAWLGYYEEGNFRILARSKKIRTPRGGPARRWGTLFHLKEGGFLEKNLPWLSEDAAIRRLARLPSSHERPASHTRP